MPVTCNKCGSKNTDTAKFCKVCGGGLQGYSPQQVNPKSIKTYSGSELLFIPGSTFQMGGNKCSDEQPVHSVTVDSFYMSKYPVTNKEYKLFKPAHKGEWSEPDYPVETVTWYDAVEYCNWLSDKEGLSKCYEISKKPESGFVSWILSKKGINYSSSFNISNNGYRLPTEAEWEYACRAGTNTKYYWGDEMDGDYCWYDGNSGKQMQSVGQKKSNAFGLYDMSGNVWEWCNDWYDKSYYKPWANSPSNNPIGPSSRRNRVYRGGSWLIGTDCRSAFRGDFPPDLGYRVLGFRPVRRVP